MLSGFLQNEYFIKLAGFLNNLFLIELLKTNLKPLIIQKY
jgi:hypothetical protein